MEKLDGPTKLDGSTVLSEVAQVEKDNTMGNPEADNTLSNAETEDSENDNMSGMSETEDMLANIEQDVEEETSDTEFEYEFFPSVPTMRRDKSASPDPAEAVLDQLYEAAQSGDSSQLVNLMFSEMKSNTPSKDKSKSGNENVKDLNADVNQNYAIMNMLKRKTSGDSDKNDGNKRSKLSVEDSPEDSDIPNFEEFESLTSIETVYDKNYVYFQNPMRKKNSHRTPTPPPCSPPKNMKLKRTINEDQFKPVDVNLAFPTWRKPRLHPVSLLPNSLNVLAAKTKQYKSLLNDITSSVQDTRLLGSTSSLPDTQLLGGTSSVQDTRLLGKSDNNTQPVNTSTTQSLDTDNVPTALYENDLDESQSDKATSPTAEKNLIDYTVLTKALSKTLESKLQEGDNDVKIVIFCNNKPIQSFSVRSNAGKQQAADNETAETTKTTETSSARESPPQQQSEDNQNNQKGRKGLLQKSMSAIAPSSPVALSLLSRINKANAHLVPPNTVPTVGEVKAILERNKMIAYESLARLRCGRKRTRQIQKELLAKLPMNFHTETIRKNEEGSSVPVTSNSSLVTSVSGPSTSLATSTAALSVSVTSTGQIQASPNSALTGTTTGSGLSHCLVASITGQGIAPLSWNTAATNNDTDKAAEDDNEGALVINESVTTDEKTSVDQIEPPVTGNNDVIGIVCDQCGKSFKHRRYLYRHRVRIHRFGKFNKPLPAKKTTKASANAKEPDGTLIANIPDNLDAIKNDLENDLENENPDVVIKTEPSTELDESTAEPEQEAEDGGDVDNVLNMLESAEKETHDIDINDDLNGVSTDLADMAAGSFLSGGTADLDKPYHHEYRTPVTPVSANGLTEPVYVCEQCGKFYRARKSLKDHFFREHAKTKDDEPLYLYISGDKYQCPICFKNFHSGTDLVVHTKKHTGESQSVCPLCSKVYSSVHVLRRHMENVHIDLRPRPFQCELCNYAASNKWHLKEHYRRHTGEQPFQCPICRKSFSHQGTMNRHCKTVHRLEVPSQRPYPRNNICDLPDLPISSSDMEYSIPDLSMPTTAIVSGIPGEFSGLPGLPMSNSDVESGIVNDSNLMSSSDIESGTATDSQLINSEMEFEELSPGASNDIDIDLSIVKTEPIEATSE